MKRILFVSILVPLILTCSSENEKRTGSDNSAINQNAGVITGIEVGNRAPELVFKSPDGENLSLSSLRGKLVLIDFWASWCSPCRRENPNLVRIYKRFRDKSFISGEGFTIYSVSLDRDRNAWLQAIEYDGLIWDSHVSDLKGPASEPAAIYGIMGIPFNFLIDGNGIIIAQALKGEMLEQKLSELLKK